MEQTHEDLSDWEDDEFFSNVKEIPQADTFDVLSTPPDSMVYNPSQINRQKRSAEETNQINSKTKSFKPSNQKESFSTPNSALKETTNYCTISEANRTSKEHPSPISRISNAKKNFGIRKRRFPGPAGLLPSLNESKIQFPVAPEKNKHHPILHQNVCSQSSLQEFEGMVWHYMLSDLSFAENDDNCPLNNLNIGYVLRRSVLRGQTSLRKEPFLVVMVKNIDLNHLDCSATFKDRTGEINGTIAAGVLEKYLPFIGPGSVLVLKDVVVIAIGSLGHGLEIVDQRKRYLNITLTSICCIYSEQNSRVTKTCISSLDRDKLNDFVLNHRQSNLSHTIIEEEEDDSETKLEKLSKGGSDAIFESCNFSFNSPSSTSLNGLQSHHPPFRRPTFVQPSPKSVSSLNKSTVQAPSSFKSPLSSTNNSHTRLPPFKRPIPSNMRPPNRCNLIAPSPIQKTASPNLSTSSNAKRFVFRSPNSFGSKSPNVQTNTLSSTPKTSRPVTPNSFKSNKFSDSKSQEQVTKTSPKSSAFNSQFSSNNSESFDDMNEDDLDEIMASIDVDSLL